MVSRNGFFGIAGFSIPLCLKLTPRPFLYKPRLASESLFSFVLYLLPYYLTHVLPGLSSESQILYVVLQKDRVV